MSEILKWRDPAAVEYVLTGDTDGRRLLRGSEGRFMPPFRFDAEKLPRGGERLRDVKLDARTIVLPILFQGVTASELRTRLRALAKVFNPKRGMGALVNTAPTGDDREIECAYRGGMEGVESKDGSGETFLKAFLFFYAPDPLYRDVADISTTYDSGDNPVWFPLFPLVLQESSVLAGVTIDNDGDDDAWPIWTVNGPGSTLAVVNETTGKRLDLAVDLAEGESVTIDTRPGKKTVVDQDGNNLYPDLDPSSSMWPLVPGDNAVQVELLDTDVASNVGLAYRRRWLVP